MLIFAHRGASATRPENTLSAFEEAIIHQADGIEIDVIEFEGEFLVLHDPNLARMTDGTGHLLDYSLQEVLNLDVGDGQRIPRLEEALGHIGTRTRVNIELKTIDNIPALLERLAQVQTLFDVPSERWLISSFNHHYLAEIAQRRPDLPLGALTACRPIDYAAFAEALGAVSVHVEQSAVSPAFVQDAHERGLAFYVYTVDRPRDLTRLREWGVDGVFTNNPMESRKVLNPDWTPEPCALPGTLVAG